MKRATHCCRILVGLLSVWAAVSTQTQTAARPEAGAHNQSPQAELLNLAHSVEALSQKASGNNKR